MKYRNTQYRPTVKLNTYTRLKLRFGRIRFQKGQHITWQAQPYRVLAYNPVTHCLLVQRKTKCVKVTIAVPCDWEYVYHESTVLHLGLFLACTVTVVFIGLSLLVQF